MLWGLGSPTILPWAQAPSSFALLPLNPRPRVSGAVRVLAPRGPGRAFCSTSSSGGGRAPRKERLSAEPVDAVSPGAEGRVPVVPTASLSRLCFPRAGLGPVTGVEPRTLGELAWVPLCHSRAVTSVPRPPRLRNQTPAPRGRPQGQVSLSKTRSGTAPRGQSMSLGHTGLRM